MEHLVIAAECDTEDNGCDVLEAVDPLLAFRSLAPDVEQPGGEMGAVCEWWAVGPRQVRGGPVEPRACRGAPLQALMGRPRPSVL